MKICESRTKKVLQHWPQIPNTVRYLHWLVSITYGPRTHREKKSDETLMIRPSSGLVSSLIMAEISKLLGMRGGLNDVLPGPMS